MERHGEVGELDDDFHLTVLSAPADVSQIIAFLSNAKMLGIAMVRATERGSQRGQDKVRTFPGPKRRVRSKVGPMEGF